MPNEPTSIVGSDSSTAGMLKPVITVNNDTLTSTFALTYQWYKDGNILNAETSQVLITTQSGLYTVEVSYYGGCGDLSDPVQVGDPSGINDPKFDGIWNIYPNPVNEQLVVELFVRRSQPLEITLINMLGQHIHAIHSLDVEGKLTYLINTTDLTPGVYYVSLKVGEHLMLRKVVKE